MENRPSERIAVIDLGSNTGMPADWSTKSAPPQPAPPP